MFFQDINSNNSNLLFRKSLINKIKKSIDYPLTTVIAGAGFGKTVSVNISLQDFKHRIIWQQLTLLDNNTTRYWANLIKNLSLIGDSVAKKIINVPFPDTPKKLDSFIALVSEEIDEDEHYILVYDDFHLIYDKDFLFFIDRIINARLPMVSIIIISRNNIPINTYGLMSKGLLLEINETDLKFTEDETIEYFNNQNIYPSELTQNEIYKQSGGWAFALYLIGRSLKQKPLSEDYALSSMKLGIHKLIESEIFLSLTDELKKFLIKLSLFENFPADLLNFLCDYDNDLIEQINNISTFIRFDIFTNTYYIHHLFLDFLYQKVNILTQDEKKQIYIKAASWYFKNNYKFDAITYYEKAEEYYNMILVIASHPLKVSKPIAEQFVKIFDRTIPLMSSEKYFAKVSRTKYKFDYDEAVALSEEINESPNIEQKNYLLMMLYAFIGYRLLMDKGEGYSKYLKLGVETKVKRAVKPIFSLKSYACIRNPLQYNSFDNYFEEISSLETYAVEAYEQIGVGYFSLTRLEYAYFKRDFKAVVVNSQDCLLKAIDCGEYYIEDLALFYNFRMKVAQGKYEDVKIIIQKLKSQLDKYQYPDYYTMYTVASDWFNILVGNTHKCKIWNSRHTLDVENMTSTDAFGCFQIVIARCYLSEEMYDELYAYLCGLENETITKDFLFGKLEVLCLKSVTLYKLDKKDDAAQTLKEAYDIAVDNDFIMPFAELGNHMLALVKYIIKANQKYCITTIPLDWLTNIQKKASAFAKQVSFLAQEYKKENNLENNLINILTKKELECFINISKGLSRSQIAADLNLSENYIKLMTQNIYSKLGISSANEAVRIATLNNLI